MGKLGSFSPRKVSSDGHTINDPNSCDRCIIHGPNQSANAGQPSVEFYPDSIFPLKVLQHAHALNMQDYPIFLSHPKVIEHKSPGSESNVIILILMEICIAL